MTNKISAEESTDQIGIVFMEEVPSTRESSSARSDPTHTSRRSLHLTNVNKFSIVAIGIIIVITAIIAGISYKIDPPVTISSYPIPGWNSDYHPWIIPATGDAPMPSAQGIEAQLANIVFDPRLAPLTVVINDARTGKNLWSYHADMLFKPASTVKLLTSTAALLVLPLNHRIKTRVMAGQVPGTIVLVGGGDPTLSTVLSTEGLYPGAATVKELADQVRKHINLSDIHTILVDQSLFSGPDFPAYWSRADIGGGSIAPIVPTMVDGDRVNPGSDYSTRRNSPGIAAGLALAHALGISQTVTVSLGTAPKQARVLGTVESAPLVDRLHQMLLMSDNVLAAEIGMEIAQSQGGPLTLEHSVNVIKHILRVNGINLRDSTIVDANGLSDDDRINPQTEMQILLAASQNNPSHPQLRNLWDSLPIAGVSGTIAERFTGDNSIGNGFIHAKTGTLNGVDALAGMVTDHEGRSLDFVIISNSTVLDISAIRRMIDSIVAQLYRCGCQ